MPARLQAAVASSSTSVDVKVPLACVTPATADPSAAIPASVTEPDASAAPEVTTGLSLVP